MRQKIWVVGAAGILAISLLGQAPSGPSGPSGPSVPPEGIPGVIAPGVQLETVAETFRFTEGPVPSAEGGLYFSDLLANKTNYMDPSGKFTVLRENTNGGNGMALMKDGSLAVAEGAAKRITKRSPDGQVTTLTEGVPGRPLLSPNDLIVDRKGGIYYTDPAPAGTPKGKNHQVYYLPPGSSASVLVDDTIDRPNGLTITRDGKTLVVDDTSNITVFAFDIQRDGTLKNKRVFITLHGIPADAPNTGADGMTIDRDGRFYIATRTGVQIFDRKGTYIGEIKVPRAIGNVAFSGPEKRTLYITARQGLYRIKTLARGVDRPGK